MYPKLAGVPSTIPSHATTSSAVASSAGRTTTSTPSIASSWAPATTPSVSARIDGGGGVVDDEQAGHGPRLAALRERTRPALPVPAAQP